MARDFDQFPFYNPLIKEGTDRISPIWHDNLATFFETLLQYLGANGMFVPQITDTQRLAILSPVNGQIIYNTTTNTFMGFIAGSWKTFTLT